MYLIINFCSLTLATIVNITDEMKLIDVNGVEHEFKSEHVHMMLHVGWSFFFIAWILNIIYYKLHPSAVDFRFARVKGKFEEYQKSLLGSSNESKSLQDIEKTTKTSTVKNKKIKDFELRPLLDNEHLNTVEVVPDNHHHIVNIDNAEDNQIPAVKVCLETHF